MRSSRQEVVNLLLTRLLYTTPSTFHDLLELQYHQIFKKRVLDHHLVSLQVFAWQKALESAQPAQLDALTHLFEHDFLVQTPKGMAHLARMKRHLEFFVVITDHFAVDGFLSVALHVVLRVLGGIEKNPDNLVAAVRLANHLDAQFADYIKFFKNREIT